MKYKINDWVEILVGKYKGHIGKINNCYINEWDIAIYEIIIKNKILYNQCANWFKECPYIHKTYSLGNCKLSIFKLKKKYSYRLTIAKGWE